MISAQSTSKLTQLDGLRGLCIICVVFYHIDKRIVSGGFVGVDVFFVVSGYLITMVILRDLQTNRFSLVVFYARRIKRLIPALYLMIAVSSICSWFLVPQYELSSFVGSARSSIIYLSNSFFAADVSYFDKTAAYKPLLHTWSLSVEEQVYLIIPVILLVVYRYCQHHLLGVLLLSAVMSFSFACRFYSIDPIRSFYFLQARFWEVSFGAAVYVSSCQITRYSRGARASTFTQYCGLLLIIASVVYLDESSASPIFLLIGPVIGASCILFGINEKSPANLVLSNRLLCHFGVISYSLYVWHQPILAFYNIAVYGVIDVFFVVCVVIIIYIISYLSYRFIESPIRYSTLVSTSVVVWVYLGVTCVFYVSISWPIYSQGLVDEQPQITAAINDWSHPGNLHSTSINQYFKYDLEQPIKVLFFGDSHAQQFTPLFDVLAAMNINVGSLTAGGCPPIPHIMEKSHSHCIDLFDRLYMVFRMEPEISTIYIVGAFNHYFTRESSPKKYMGDDFDYYVEFEQKNAYLRHGFGYDESLFLFRQFLLALPHDVRIIVIGDNPDHDSFDPKIISQYLLRGESTLFKRRFPDFVSGKFSVPARQLQIDNDIKIQVNYVGKYISVIPIVCPELVCSPYDQSGRLIYKDTNHMRPHFVRESFRFLLS